MMQPPAQPPAGEGRGPGQGQRAQRPAPPEIPPEFQAAAIMKMGEAELIAMLKDPAATQFRKSKACMRLAMVGTKEAVPVLAPLLSDPTYNHLARFGLVPINDASVDEALRAALATLKGNLLVGVVDSIGQRRDVKAVDALIKLMNGPDEAAALAAIASLGRITTAGSTAALQAALTRLKEPRRTHAANALLVAAEGWLNQGDRKQAFALYDRLSRTDIPKAIRLAAMNSTITLETSPARPKQGPA